MQVVLSSLVISHYPEMLWVDPLCSVIIALMMIHLVLPLLTTTIGILAQQS